MSAVPVDEGGLFVALALVPGFASRNRHPEIYESHAGKRARTRARRMRAFLSNAATADEAEVSLVDGKLSVTVSRAHPRSSWTLFGDELDAVVCRYLLARGGGDTHAERQLLTALPAGGDVLIATALAGMQRIIGL